MSTMILLAKGADPFAISIARTGPGTRLVSALRASELDRRLAAGANPDSSALLSLRARQLEKPANRRRLALGLRRRLSASLGAPHPTDRRVPLARAEIRQSAELIEELAALLEAPQPADPQGIAQASVLIGEGNSPLYRQSQRGVLAPALRRVIDSLALPAGFLATD
jgi:hypothetical protein